MPNTKGKYVAEQGFAVKNPATGVETDITPSHFIKFVKLGSAITSTTLTGLAVGDLVIRFAVDGTVTAKPCATINTLPDNPADTDYLVVLRATA